MRSTMKFSQKMINMPALVILALSVRLWSKHRIFMIETGACASLYRAHILERQFNALSAPQETP